MANLKIIAQTPMDLPAILHAAQQQCASDVHFDATVPQIYIRVSGRLRVLSGVSIDALGLNAWLAAQISDAQRELLDNAQSFDFSYITKNIRTRVSVYFSNNGVSLAIRLLASAVPALDEMGAPQFLRDLSPYQNGLVLVTGPTGSGKSTTLASYLRHITPIFAAHVVTLEDPIEYLHQNDGCVFHQTQKYQHFDNYADALKHSLRRDPDVIVVGELRDLASIEMALRAAETGHLVIATLHSADATSAITRLIDVFSADSQNFVRQVLSSVLLGVVAQRLLPCAPQVSQFERIATFETLVANAAVRNLIKEGKELQLPNLMQTHAQQGMFTFKQDLQKLIDSGSIVDFIRK